MTAPDPTAYVGAPASFAPSASSSTAPTGAVVGLAADAEAVELLLLLATTTSSSSSCRFSSPSPPAAVVDATNRNPSVKTLVPFHPTTSSSSSPARASWSAVGRRTMNSPSSDGEQSDWRRASVVPGAWGGGASGERARERASARERRRGNRGQRHCCPVERPKGEAKRGDRTDVRPRDIAVRLCLGRHELRIGHAEEADFDPTRTPAGESASQPRREGKGGRRGTDRRTTRR